MRASPSAATAGSLTLPESRWCLVLAGVAFALTLARWLVPAEATLQGETLWIAILWMVAAVLLGGLGWTHGLRRRSDLVDAAVACFVGGQVLAGVLVMATTGDRRAALNLVWEWLSLGVFWIVWRELLCRIPIRRAVFPFLMTTAVTLSLWGIWQAYVWYPQMQRTYGLLFEELKFHEQQGNDTASVRQKLHEAGIPTEGPSRKLYEDRLRESHEPFGPFALANTFGGLLAAWLVLAGSRGWSGDQANSVRGFLRHLPTLGLIAFCLFLTNSRTAMVGVLSAVLVAWAIQAARRSSSYLLRRGLIPGVGVAGVVAGALIFWLITRDVHLVPGPLKSLAYRAEYWTGTWRLLLTSPWTGIGPGQFRDQYLRFKLPESSEEIADPHNLLLDVWANGGLISLLGAVALIVLFLRRVLVLSQSLPAGLPGLADPRIFSWRLAGVLAFGLTIIGQLLFTGVWDSSLDRLAVFGLIWLGVAWGWPGRDRDAAPELWCLAAVALTVHLLGAGGIAMPAVTQLWLLLIACGSESKCDQTAQGSARRWWSASLLVSGMIAAGGCWWTASLPVARVQRLMAQADAEWLLRHNPVLAGQTVDRAIAADAWAVEPRIRQAEILYAKATGTPGRPDRSAFEAAVAQLDAAIALVPQRPMFQARKAEMFAGFARRSRQPDDLTSAATHYESARTGYPTNTRWLAEAALVLAEIGGPRLAEAGHLARLAIAQDDINQQRGHQDRYLPASLRREMQRLADESKTP